MSVRPYRDIIRRKSRKIRVGNVEVGGDAPISVQSMTNTPTSDARATIAQVKRLEDAGADIVRVSCPDEDSTKALKTIVRAARVPIVADIHFHYKRALEAAERALPACGSIPAISVPSSACAKLSKPPRIMAAPCASA
jgi:(E)-4-hydroxy-3-methylbut-2-enyl-diphosphate synthase